MFLSLFFVLLAITAIYGIRAFDDYNIFTLYKGDIVGILTVVCSLLSIITLSIANAYVTLRTINVVSPISEAGENKDTVYIEPPVPIIPKKSTTDSCTLSKKVLLPKTPQNNIKIEKEPTFDMVLYKALLHLKNEYDLKKAEDSSISQSGYVSNNPSENIGRIRPIVIKINEGKDEKVVYSAEELKKYV